MIEVKNFTKKPLAKKFLIRVAKTVLKGENREKQSLSIVFTGENRIKKLNKKYRKENKTTDVLSFGESPKFKTQNLKDTLGEIIICPQKVEKNSRKYKTAFKEELVLVLIHGILHLLGYDHEKTEREKNKTERKQHNYFLKIFPKLN